MIDKRAGPLDTARGDHLQPASCELLAAWDVLENLFTAGAEKRLDSIWYARDGRELLHSSMAELDIPHPYFAFLNHEKIGAVLMACAETGERVRVIQPIRNCWFEKTSAGEHVTRVSPRDGNDLIIRSRVLIGADGRVSRVRKAHSIAATTHRYARSIAVFFARSDAVGTENALRVFLTDTAIVSVIPRTGGGCKIAVPLLPDEARAWRNADHKERARRLAVLLPAPRFSELQFADIYPPISLKANAWCDSTVCLIGDACHAMHPARSLGMNITLRCIEVLSQCLETAGSPLTPVTATEALDRYQSTAKQWVDRQLVANHQSGLQMDRADAESLDGLETRLREIQADPVELRAYSMRAAGYADGGA